MTSNCKDFLSAENTCKKTLSLNLTPLKYIWRDFFTWEVYILIAETLMFLRLCATAERGDLLRKSSSFFVFISKKPYIEIVLKEKLVLVPPRGCLLRRNYKYSGQFIYRCLMKNQQQFYKVKFRFTLVEILQFMYLKNSCQSHSTFHWLIPPEISLRLDFSREP